MAQQISIDTEAVMSAANQIDVLISDIDQRIQKFLVLLNENNAKTQGKFPIIKALVPRIQKEAEAIKKTTEALDTIRHAIDKYTDMAADAVDMSFLGPEE